MCTICSQDPLTFQILMCFHSPDMGLKTSSYLTEILLDPDFGHAYEANKTAFNKTYNVKEDAWSWIERPENRLHLVRFGAAMNGSKNASPANAILEGSVKLCVRRHDLISKISNDRVWLGTPS